MGLFSCAPHRQPDLRLVRLCGSRKLLQGRARLYIALHTGSLGAVPCRPETIDLWKSECSADPKK